ncbi:Ger(x)C family spore germination protein [Metabacillus malikii]|uniref:Spore germination protein KC n=1 Tax=Metabacillus malikii TaxID=1504265 RepID=A0ABT9ZME3_9BACI|nr:Ger(x)C family spore germination protein [Metabacillus malikii]MDQ0233458.1 spore germination protein KC [Metabacillus malikii]
MNKWLLFIICSMFFLTGCWDRKEIEERATILGLAIDIAEDEEEQSSITHPDDIQIPTSNIGNIKVTAQLAVPGQIPLGPSQGESGSSSQDKVWVVEGVGHTMDDAIQALQQQLAHKVFFGQLQVVILSENVAEKGINHINEFLRRRPEIRRTAWMAVNENNAAKTMRAAPKLERIPAIYLSTVFEEAVRMGKLPNCDLGTFWVGTSNIGQDGFLPYITVKSKENIEISGLAFFSNSKMAGKTQPYQIAYANELIGNNPGGAVGLIKLDEEKAIMFQSTNRSAKYEVSLKNGRPEFNVNVRIKGIIREKNTNKLKIDDEKTLAHIEKVATAQLEKEYRRLIEETKEKRSDIFGFGEYVRGELPAYWDQEIKTTAKWKELYKDLKVHVKANVKIEGVGLKAS